tara:strand:+ start:6386 stop:8230 length:1845 start_codon:yes stop_codon:yes gene_type:complete
MALADLGLNRSRSAIVFLVPESVNGTIFTDATNELPQRPKHLSDTDTDAFGLVTVPVIGQQGNYSDTSEIGPELITTDRVLNYMEYSTFDLEYYAKPGGRTTSITAASIGNCTPTEGADVGGLATVTLTASGAGKFDGMAVGDTIVVSGTNDVNANGTFMVHAVSLSGSSPTISYLAKVAATSLNMSGNTAQVSKVVMALPKEDVILSRCFGGTKFMSFAHNGYASGSSSTTSGSGNTAITGSNCTVVSYFLKNISQTLTVHSRQFTEDAIQMYTATGALPTSFSVTFAKDGAVTYTSGFQSNRVFYTGTAEITGEGGSATADTNIVETIHSSGTFNVKVTAPKRHFKDSAVNASDVLYTQTVAGSFTAGSFVKIRRKSAAQGDTDHGPYEVKAISGDIVTLGGSDSTDTIAAASSEAFYLIPHMPDAALSTTVLDQRKVQVFIADAVKDTGNDLLHYNPGTANVTDANALASATSATTSHLFNLGNALDVTSVNFDFDRAITTPALTEMSGEEFPAASYVINEPTITGSVTLLLRPKDFQFMNSLREEPRRSIGVRAGSVDGKIIEMGAASAFFEVPTPADADGATQIDIPFTVIRGNLGETDDANKFFLRYR